MTAASTAAPMTSGQLGRSPLGREPGGTVAVGGACQPPPLPWTAGVALGTGGAGGATAAGVTTSGVATTTGPPSSAVTPPASAARCAAATSSAGTSGVLLFSLMSCSISCCHLRDGCHAPVVELSLIHISEPPRLGMISY